MLDGIPGLSDLPVVGRLFAHTRTETTQTDIILTLTPHIIRVLDLTEADLRAFRVGRDSTGADRGAADCRSTCRRPPAPAGRSAGAADGSADSAAGAVATADHNRRSRHRLRRPGIRPDSLASTHDRSHAS